MITRRLFGLGLLAAPAIIRTPGLLMPIKPFRLDANMTWLQEQVERALLDAINQDGPLRYNDEGLMRVRQASLKFFDGLGTPLIYTINGMRVAV